MSRALTLALALAAGRAQADAGGGLLVSALFGTEPPSYVHAAVSNVLSFTLPSTKIVVHLSAASLAKPDSFTDPRKAGFPEPSFAAAAAALRARNASVYYGFGSNATTKRKHRLVGNATLVRKKVPWYRRHGHANATVARRHRGRHANATRLHHRRNHPRRHNPDGLGAPTPGDAADGVVAPAGISSALEALAALHQKGALTDGEFAAAKAKLLG